MSQVEEIPCVVLVVLLVLWLLVVIVLTIIDALLVLWFLVVVGLAVCVWRITVAGTCGRMRYKTLQNTTTRVRIIAICVPFFAWKCTRSMSVALFLTL